MTSLFAALGRRAHLSRLATPSVAPIQKSTARAVMRSRDIADLPVGDGMAPQPGRLSRGALARGVNS